MANHKSSKKSIKQIAKHTARNRDRVSRIKTFIKKVEEAITGTDKAAAQSALSIAQSEIMKGVTKGVLKLKTASRKVSRLAAKVKSIAS